MTWTLEDVALVFPVGTIVEWLEWEWTVRGTVCGPPTANGQIGGRPKYDVPVRPEDAPATSVVTVAADVLLLAPEGVLELRKQMVVAVRESASAAMQEVATEATIAALCDAAAIVATYEAPKDANAPEVLTESERILAELRRRFGADHPRVLHHQRLRGFP